MSRQGKRKDSPEDASLARDIEEQLKNGAWREDPWFLKYPEGISSSTGQGRYSNQQLVRAADALVRVYTPEACRRIFANPGRGPSIMILFELVDRERLFRLVRLGLDLADIGPSAEAIYDRLRDGPEFDGARLEVELWAALVRSRIDVDHEPDVALPADGPGPDLRATFDYREYFIEAKYLNAADADLIGREIMQTFSNLTMGRINNSTGWILRFSSDFARLPLTPEGRKALQAKADDVARALAALVLGAANNTTAIGEHDVLGLGSVRIEREVDAACVLSVDEFEESPPEKESERVYRLVRDAARQLPPRGRGVVFVDAHRDIDLDDLQRLFVARATLTGPTFGNVHFVILRTSRRPIQARLVPVPGVEPTTGDRNIARALLSGRG